MARVTKKQEFDELSKFGCAYLQTNSYGGYCIVIDDCGDNSIDITIQAGCTSGYYEAANFDWFVNIKTCRKVDYYYETCDYDYNDLTADDVIRDDWYDNKGLSKIHAAHILRKIESIIDDLKNEAEIAFSMYCDEEMYCTFRAFNGEAGYSKTGKRLWQEVEEQKKKTA